MNDTLFRGDHEEDETYEASFDSTRPTLLENIMLYSVQIVLLAFVVAGILIIKLGKAAANSIRKIYSALAEVAMISHPHE